MKLHNGCPKLVIDRRMQAILGIYGLCERQLLVASAESIIFSNDT